MKNIFKRIASMIACFACIVSISTNAYARSYSVDKRGEYTEVITGGDSDNSGIALCGDDDDKNINNYPKGPNNSYK